MKMNSLLETLGSVFPGMFHTFEGEFQRGKGKSKDHAMPSKEEFGLTCLFFPFLLQLILKH